MLLVILKMISIFDQCKKQIQIRGGGTTLERNRELSIIIVQLYKACLHDRPFLMHKVIPFSTFVEMKLKISLHEIQSYITSQKDSSGHYHPR